MKDQLERNLYQHLLIAFTMGGLVIGFTTHLEPSWISTPRAIELRQQGATFLDIRRTTAMSTSGIPDALAIPTRELEARIAEVPRDRPVVVYGAIGTDSLAAYQLLRERGYDVYDLGPKSRFPRSALHVHTAHQHHDHAGHEGHEAR